MKDVLLTAGVDVGSSAVKVAVVRSEAGSSGAVLTSSLQRIRRRAVADVVRAAFDEALLAASVKASDLDYIASTGDGDAVDFRTGHFYSMTTHARGALHLAPEARAALDVGALHARAMKVGADGRVLSHRMTSQCASGSGQFVENIARYLGVTLEDVGRLSRSSTQPEKVSSICAVLAETDVINMVSRGIATSDILKGIHLSIAGRLLQLLRSAGAEGLVLLTGGLALDEGLVGALNDLLAEERERGRVQADLALATRPESILGGAIGAALLGARRRTQLDRKRQPAASAALGPGPE